MKRFVIVTVASVTLLSAALAVAEDAAQFSNAPQSQVYYYQQPAGAPQYYSQAQPQPAQRQGFFGRMMELERRKNQALLRFFGLR
jgi:hypothetical protein